MVERDRERRQKEFDKKVKSNSDLFNEDTDSESENFEPRKIKYKSRKTLDSSDSEGNKVGCVFPMVSSSDFRMGQQRGDDHQDDAPFFISNMNHILCILFRR